ncbi:MAG: type III-B CRISPR module-associated protein Cmr5 [Candidatus Binatia bacterium]
MPTRDQERAQRAYLRVIQQSHDEETRKINAKAKKEEAEYERFAKRFPALIQNCGLAQAVAFAEAKAPKPYLTDLAHVVTKDLPTEQLAQQVREAPLVCLSKAHPRHAHSGHLDQALCGGAVERRG